ncbi:hypothetical protein CY35_08G006800 [Sphagnum magellanicum]|nr:hypothetical protein CY35_08G006800 [Sphagnum magellanicum]
MSGAAAVAAAPYCRNAGMTYISYANTCAAMVRNCLKEPHKIKALNREQVYYKLQIYQEGEPHKAVVQETPSPTCKERLISDISGDIGIRESGGLGCMA